MINNSKIVIIDSGYGNSKAVRNMLLFLGLQSKISREAKDLDEATQLILPGVGSFDAAMKSISPIANQIREIVMDKNIPILGICLGMQLLGTSSEEGNEKGLNLIEGHCAKITPSDNYKVPHLNWEFLSFDNSSFFSSFNDNPKFYFAHSYHFIPEDKSVIGASFLYPDKIVAMIKKGNICGVQFHPEKSHIYGQNFFKKYFDLK